MKLARALIHANNAACSFVLVFAVSSLRSENRLHVLRQIVHQGIQYGCTSLLWG